MYCVHVEDHRVSIWLDCRIHARDARGQVGQSLGPSSIALGKPEAWLCVYGGGRTDSRVSTYRMQ